MFGQSDVLPMKVAGTHHIIECTYRESGSFQWVRETLINALQAKATRIEFGIEWQAVESRGVHRRRKFSRSLASAFICLGSGFPLAKASFSILCLEPAT